MSTDRLTLGLYQGIGTPGDVGANLAEMREAIAQAAVDGIELLVFPEGFLTGYYLPAVTRLTLPDTVDATQSLCEAARKAGIGVVFGLAERSAGGAFNAAIAIAPDGSVVARYHKRALFGDWEKGLFTPGAQPVLFDFRGFRIALLICYDLEFPELAREAAGAGADLIVVPTSLMLPYDEVADHLVPTRALENQIFVAYANRAGAENGLHYAGKSTVSDPLGRSLAKAGSSGPTRISATLDKVAIAEARARYSYLGDLQRLSLRR